MPVISIVVPVYKVEAYLESCIRSLLAQTFRDIEIILVDDGSPDQCGALCDRLAAEDSRVVVIHQKNKGLSGARNTGLDAARGEYICFVDSDDLVQPTYCEELLEALQGSGCDFSVCASHRFEDGSAPCPRKSSDSVQIVSNRDFLEMQFDRHSEFGVWNKLMPKKILEEFRFKEGKLNEDVIFSADLAKHLHNGVACVSSELHLYRQRGSSIMGKQAQKGSPDRIFAGEYLLEAVRESCPDLLPKALAYAVGYPWMFIDPIYVHRSFADNREFLDSLQNNLKRYLTEYEAGKIFPELQLRRMKLFAKSRFLYGFNAYARLFRVYLYRLIGKDAYQDGHGI